MAKVRLTNLTKTFFDTQTKQEVVALANLNLEIEDGEFLVLVGPSGCGKSTALRLIAGLEEASGGEIAIGDRVVNDLPPRERNIAMVFQNYALYPHMTVYDNLAFGLRNRMLRGPLWQLARGAEARDARLEIDRQVRETAALLEIEPLLERLPRALSGGQRQRVALGRAIVRRPQVFLMDEPLSNLDAQLRVQTRAEIVKLHRKLGITTIYVTHDQAEAMTMGHRIAVLKAGVLQQCAAPLDMYREPANRSVAGFIGTPAMNFLEARVGDDLSLNAGAFRARLPDVRTEALRPHIERTVVIGLRPEDIREGKPDTGEIGFRATVDLVEPLGSSSIVALKTEEVTLLAALPATTSARTGQPLEVAFDRAALRAFDSESGARIA